MIRKANCLDQPYVTKINFAIFAYYQQAVIKTVQGIRTAVIKV